MDFEKLFEEYNDVDVKIPDLKRCPFCGGEAAILHYQGEGGYFPHCTECDGMVERRRETEEEAVEQWNRMVNNE